MRPLFLIFHIFFLCKNYGYTQERYRAVNWGVEDGLRMEYVHNAIIKDINGFLWFGSPAGELSKFDGKSFRQYYPNKNKAGSIRNNNPLSFVEDSLHNIWIGTLNGLSRYDMNADTFTNIDSILGVINLLTIPFWVTKDAVYCIESWKKIVSYDILSFTKKELMGINPEDGAGENISYPSYAVFHEGTQSVWMLPGGKLGLIEYSLNTGKVIQHPRLPYKINHSNHFTNDAQAMRYDKLRNCIWINSYDGLVQFTFDDQQFHHIDALNLIINQPEYDRFTGIDIDPKGRIWFATKPNGIIVYDPETGIIIDPLKDSVLQKKVSWQNLKIYCDRDGIVWTSFTTGTNGIYQLAPYDPIIKRYTSGGANALISVRIENMIPDNQGNLWIGTWSGLNVFNPKTEQFKIVRPPDLSPTKGGYLVPYAMDTINHKIWLCTSSEEIVEMDLSTLKCKLITFKDTNDQIIVHQGSVFPIPFNQGLIFYDDAFGIFEITSNSLIGRLVIPLKGGIAELALGDNQHLFIKLWNQPQNLTYTNMNGQWTRTPHLMDSMAWSYLIFDNVDQTYWVSLSNELIHYDKNFNLIRNYTDETGLINFPVSILPDGRGNIWFNNIGKGISCLNKNTGIITTLSESEGYQKQTFNNASSKARLFQGELYFAGDQWNRNAEGLDRITISRYAASPPSTVYIKSLKINSEENKSIGDLNDMHELSLRYFENKIDIETGILNFYSKGKSSLRYKFEKNEKPEQWQYAPYYSNIRYEELPPGNYKLTMQASNAGGEFNGPEKILNVHIDKPFWKTWWFILVLACSSIGLVYIVIYWWLQYTFRQKLKVQLMRQKIAADLHDEIGSNLSSMNFGLELVKKNISGSNPYVDKMLNQLVTNAKDTSTLISDTIWSLNPDNDSFERLKEHMKNFTHDILTAKEIDYEFNLKGHVLSPILSIEQKRNIYLIFKEAINNIAKHSKASQVNISFETLVDRLTVEIMDNGIGFNTLEVFQGNGLNNFKARSIKDSSEVQYSSILGKGTVVRIMANYKS